MKKLLTVSPFKILMVCGLGLMMTLGGFWHLQTNQSQIDRMSVLGQGIGTCFNRISQTFTALMIKDVHSAYLNRGFMNLSDECLSEAIKGINPFKQSVGSGYEMLNKLISDVHWFHETVAKTHGPMIVGKSVETSLSPISNKFSEMESLKVSLVDEIDVTVAKIREIQGNDEILTGIGLLFFVLSVSLMAWIEFHNIRTKRSIEAEALNLLSKGQTDIGAMVDRLVDKGLVTYGLKATAQIFRDYHGDLLEKLSHKMVPTLMDQKSVTNPVFMEKTGQIEAEEELLEQDHANHGPQFGFKEALVSIQNIHSKEILSLGEIRDVQLAIDGESLEQMLSAAINKLADRRQVNKKIMISNQVHADRSLVNLFLAGGNFTASELEFAQTKDAQSMDVMDVNFMILRELVASTGTQWHVENKTDKSGNIIGMNLRFIINRVPKENRPKNLVSVVKGKKKNISKEMMN